MSKTTLSNGTPPPDSSADDGETSMGILDHLNELRRYVVRAVIGLALATIVSFVFTGPLFSFLTGCNFPAIFIDRETILASCTTIQAIRPTEPLEVYFRIAFTAGAILSMPWILFQLWQFIKPALRPQEKRYVYLFVPVATLLFLSGVVFAWVILMPPAMAFLNTFLSDTLEIQWTVENYIDFVTGFLFWLGVAFEMPLIIYFLARFGLVTPLMLRSQWRFAIVGIAVLAAVITPSADPVTMLLTMVPLTILYIISIGLAGIGTRQFNRA